MSSNKAAISDEDLQNFCAVTGASLDRARFYVEAANGDLGIAIESFFETDAAIEQEDMATEPSGKPATKPFGLDVDINSDDDSADEDYTPTVKPTIMSKSTPDKKPTRKAGNIFTLNEMNNDEDEDNDEKGQAFYAGGSETSGQQILGPPKKKNPESIIKDLFQKAKENGAQEVDQSEATSSKKAVSYGSGYRLGTGNEPTEVIPGPPKQKQQKVSVLKLWKNGFNVDDGQLRSYEDEKNKEFLQSIQRGELPRELVHQADGGEVHLDMQDHREEEFVPPKAAYKLFNEGYKLGSTTAAAPVVSNLSPLDKTANEETAKTNLGLEASKPSTQIQIRLSDGSRLIIKANLTHKISQLRTYINTARPEYKQRSYALLTSFPNKELSNESETVEEAKLQNAVIIQKL